MLLSTSTSRQTEIADSFRAYCCNLYTRVLTNVLIFHQGFGFSGSSSRK